jgi:hypothetical protein
VKISFFNSENYDGNAKAAIHASGKLGFSDIAITKLDIGNSKGIIIGYNEADSSDKNLYVIPTKEEEAGAFKINKSGKYFYVNTRPLFDSMEIPYKTHKIIYDIVDFNWEGRKMYKFIYRQKERIQNSNP